jgi:hypothetical protein
MRSGAVELTQLFYYYCLTALWTRREFYVGRRYTQALGCVLSSEMSRFRSHQGRNFHPTYLTGRAVKGTWVTWGGKKKRNDINK